MARVSTAFSFLVLALTASLLFMSRDGGLDRRDLFATSGVDPMPTGSTNQAAKAKHMRDTLAP